MVLIPVMVPGLAGYPFSTFVVARLVPHTFPALTDNMPLLKPEGAFSIICVLSALAELIEVPAGNVQV